MIPILRKLISAAGLTSAPCCVDLFVNTKRKLHRSLGVLIAAWLRVFSILQSPKRDAAPAALANMKEHKAVAETLNQEQITRFASQLSDRLQKGTVAFQKGYLRILLGKIIVHKDRVELLGRTDKLVEALALSTTSDETKVRAHV